MNEELKQFVKDIFEEVPENYRRVGKYFFMCGVIVTLYRNDCMSGEEYERAVSDLCNWCDSDKQLNGIEYYRC